MEKDMQNERWSIAEQLKAAAKIIMEEGTEPDTTDGAGLASSCYALLWDAVVLFQNVEFTTSGRGKRPGLPFTYTIKKGRNGGLTNELMISRKQQSKTITRSTIELAFSNALTVQKEYGCVSGPKKLGCFGSSYLYALFIEWGIIKAKAI